MPDDNIHDEKMPMTKFPTSKCLMTMHPKKMPNDKMPGDNIPDE